MSKASFGRRALGSIGAQASVAVDELVPVGGALTHAEALTRMVEAEDTLRAIGAGQVDAFVLTDANGDPRVFALTTADRPYRNFVEYMRDGAATTTVDGLILYANERLSQLLGVPRELIVGERISRFVAVGSPPLVLERASGELSLSSTVELGLVTADGRVLPALVGLTSLDVDGDVLTCLTFADLSTQKAQEQEIARLGREQSLRMADLQSAQAALIEQATHDALTGLPNRALLVDRIDQALAYAARSGRCTAVLFIDLDHFKQVNDSQGHAAGDDELRRVAGALTATLRTMDTVARLGGDEFVALVPNLDSHFDAVDLSNRVIVELGRGAHDAAARNHVGASIGIAVSIGGQGSAELLLRESDTAMYHAKALGGGRAEMFDTALNLRVQERATSERLLRSALDERRVILHYQPIVDLATGRIASFEALARVREWNGSISPPSSFIPVAEESGLIVELGAQILALSCEQGASWQRSYSEATCPAVAVNLSSCQLDVGDLTDSIVEQLTRTSLRPASLHLELTETAIMDLRPATLKQLARLRDQGIQIGLDDFGTGYASLTHLRQLPITFVKIDRSFVQGIGVNQDDDRIVSAVVDLAAHLGLRSVAEGVEAPEQLRRLRQIGCDQAQGFLISRPSPPAEVARLLQHEPW